MAYGFYQPGSLHDSFGRAAMAPGGAVQGVTDLGQALLLDAQHKRQMQMQMNAVAAQRDFQNRQLAQALNIAQMHNQTMKDVAKERADALDAWHSADVKERGAAADATNQEKQREFNLNALGSTAKYLANTKLGQALGLGEESAGAQTAAAKAAAAGSKAPPFSPYKHVTKYNDQGQKIDDEEVLKTPDEVDQERSLRDRYLNGALNGQAPAAPTPAEVQANQARSAAVREQQRAQGLAQAPGDPTPPPSTAGTTPGAVVAPPRTAAPAAAAPAPAPAAAPKPIVRTQDPVAGEAMVTKQLPDLMPRVQAYVQHVRDPMQAQALSQAISRGDHETADHLLSTAESDYAPDGQ